MGLALPDPKALTLLVATDVVRKYGCQSHQRAHVE